MMKTTQFKKDYCNGDFVVRKKVWTQLGIQELVEIYNCGAEQRVRG